MPSVRIDKVMEKPDDLCSPGKNITMLRHKFHICTKFSFVDNLRDKDFFILKETETAAVGVAS